MQSNKLYFLLPCFLIFVMESQSMDLTTGLKDLQRSLTSLKHSLQSSPVSEKGFDPTEQVNITKDALRAAFKAAQEQIKIMVNFSESTKNLVNEFLQYIEDNKDVKSVTETPDIVTRLYDHIEKSFNKTTLQAFIEAINKLVIAMRETRNFEGVEAIKVYLGNAIDYFDNFYTIKYKYYFGNIERVTNPKFPFLLLQEELDVSVNPWLFFYNFVYVKIPVSDLKEYEYVPGRVASGARSNLNYILYNAVMGKISY